MNDKDIALFAAAPPGDAETVRQLLAQGASVKYQNAGGARHTEVVRLLVQAGAIVNLADSNGVTPLAHAKQRGDKDIAAILERAGAG